MQTYEPRAESPFSEGEEQELAAELLGVTNDQELDQLLGALLRRAASAVGGNLHSAVGHALGGLAKGAVRKVLPGMGLSFDSSAAGDMSQLVPGAGRLLGFEGEGMSAEDQELNAATQLVRLAGSAAAQAAANPSAGAPTEVARQAMVQAAQRHAPGLVRSAPHQHSHRSGCTGGNGGECSCQRAKTGSWERRGRAVILHGV
jgi:hypothetical protein